MAQRLQYNAGGSELILSSVSSTTMNLLDIPEAFYVFLQQLSLERKACATFEGGKVEPIVTAAMAGVYKSDEMDDSAISIDLGKNVFQDCEFNQYQKPTLSKKSDEQRCSISTPNPRSLHKIPYSGC